MSGDAKREHQRPEGKLLERSMKGPPKVSGRQLAELAGLSEGRVRQIVNGYRSEAGMVVPIVAPAETLARLGAALNLEPSHFMEAGRSDVAEILRGEISAGVTEEGELWLADVDHLRVDLLDWLKAGIESDPPHGPLMLWSMEALLTAAEKKHRDEIHFMNSLLQLERQKNVDGGDGDAEESRGSAPTNPGDFDLAAHDESHAIEDEQGHDDHA